LSRFYDAMKRAFEADADTQPDIVADVQLPDKTDPEIELEQLEADVAAANQPPPEVSHAPIPIRPVEVSHTLVEANQGEPIQPSYERLIQRLLAFRGGRRHCVILVAGAVPGDGASTVARDLAGALGQSQNGRTALVDANMRRPSQQNAFEIEDCGGFFDVLRGEKKLESVLHDIPNSSVTVLNAGDVTDGTPHLLTVPSVQKVVTSLHSQNDWVILDGPAVTTSPDASTLAAVADGAILVLRAEHTRWEVAEEARKLLDQAGVNLLGGVLNRRKYHIPDFLYRRL